MTLEQTLDSGESLQDLIRIGCGKGKGVLACVVTGVAKATMNAGVAGLLLTRAFDLPLATVFAAQRLSFRNAWHDDLMAETHEAQQLTRWAVNMQRTPGLKRHLFYRLE
jgi:hypothetical protein